MWKIDKSIYVDNIVVLAYYNEVLDEAYPIYLVPIEITRHIDGITFYGRGVPRHRMNEVLTPADRIVFDSIGTKLLKALPITNGDKKIILAEGDIVTIISGLRAINYEIIISDKEMLFSNVNYGKFDINEILTTTNEINHLGNINDY